MLALDLDLKVTEAVNDVSNGVERMFSVIVRDSVRAFLANVVRESLIYREDEWKAHDGVVVNDSAAFSTIASLIRDRLQRLLMAAAHDPLNRGLKQILLIDVLEEIQRQWASTGIFPICR